MMRSLPNPRLHHGQEEGPEHHLSESLWLQRRETAARRHRAARSDRARRDNAVAGATGLGVEEQRADTAAVGAAPGRADQWAEDRPAPGRVRVEDSRQR